MSKDNMNNITLDKIVTKVPSKEYMDKYDAIFRKDREHTPESYTHWVWINPPMAEICPPPDKPVVATEDWDEDRMDTIGQNGNNGYEDSTE